MTGTSSALRVLASMAFLPPCSEGMHDFPCFSLFPPRSDPPRVWKRSGYISRSEGACARAMCTSMPKELITCHTGGGQEGQYKPRSRRPKKPSRAIQRSTFAYRRQQYLTHSAYSVLTVPPNVQ
eukprot:174174-Prorocentrum_minimum.AAC.1